MKRRAMLALPFAATILPLAAQDHEALWLSLIHI